jgi:hypothetical protein
MKTKRYESGGVLRDSSGNPVRSGSGEPVGTRYKDSDTKAAESYDLESVKKPRSIEEQIGRKAESKEEEPRRKIEDYSKSSGPFSNVKAAVESATSKGTESSASAPVKKAMKVAEKAAPKKEAESKYEDTGAKVGSQGSFKFDSKPMSVEEARKKAKEMTSGKKGPTEAQKESGRKFSEEKLKKQKESFESSPVGGFLKRLGESPMEKAERKAKEIRGYKSGGSVSSASKRADGIAMRGKTRGRIC